MIFASAVYMPSASSKPKVVILYRQSGDNYSTSDGLLPADKLFHPEALPQAQQLYHIQETAKKAVADMYRILDKISLSELDKL